MKNFFSKAITVVALCIGFSSIQAQDAKDAKESKYSYVDAFAPNFYTKNGNEYRSASGQPGPKYWQNRADYVLTANLN